MLGLRSVAAGSELRHDCTPGPGSGSLMAAASAWNQLAGSEPECRSAELRQGCNGAEQRAVAGPGLDSNGGCGSALRGLDGHHCRARPSRQPAKLVRLLRRTKPRFLRWCPCH